MSLLPSRRFWRGPWPWLIAAAALGCVALLRWTLAPERVVDPRPIGGADAIAALKQRKDVNVLFVLIDTLRADRLRTYGYVRPTSPVFDVLAGQGVRFGRHLSQSSWTKSSMASLWTGLYPARAGVTRFDDVLPQEARLPAEILREAGFRTAGIWRNGWVEDYFGFGQGFEVYTRPQHSPATVNLRRKNPTLSQGGTDFDAVNMAAAFLRIHGRERWFLYLHLMDVHEYTYDERSARFGAAYSDVYDNAILHVNTVIDALLGHLLTGGYLANTLIVIASDHGEAFGERGSEGHARNVYPETTEVPLILAFPFRLQPGVVIHQRSANVDLWPTLLDLLGLPPLERSDGRSRVPEILAAVRGEPEPQDGNTAIAHLDQTWGQRVETAAPTVSISEQSFRYVAFHNANGKILREELFDASRDAREREDRLADEPEVAGRLRERAKSYLASKPFWKDETPQLEIDEIQLNQLRALGYAVP